MSSNADFSGSNVIITGAWQGAGVVTARALAARAANRVLIAGGQGRRLSSGCFVEGGASICISDGR